MPSGLINDAEIKSSVHSSKNVGATFDFVETTFDFVAKNGNNVESTFDTVERIVKHVAFDTVASTLLLVWTGFKIK